jgi:hypothetical protein
MKRNLSILIFAAASVCFVGCTTTGNAPKGEDVKYDYVAGYAGEDKVLVSDDDATLHSDRDAVAEYTKTVDTINSQRQLVEADLFGINACRKRAAAEKKMKVSDAPLKVECMAEVVNKRDSAGGDLVQVNGKLVLRKKDDFKARLEEAQSCLTQMIRVRDMARESYNNEDCDQEPSTDSTDAPAGPPAEEDSSN